MHASDIAVTGSGLSPVLTAIRLSRRTMRIIRGNLFWAFAYNVAALPLAALGVLNPMIAGAAMAFSSVFVVLNSRGCAADPLVIPASRHVREPPPVRPNRGGSPAAARGGGGRARLTGGPRRSSPQLAEASTRSRRIRASRHPAATAAERLTGHPTGPTPVFRRFTLRRSMPTTASTATASADAARPIAARPPVATTTPR
jgi:hypothetical protein